MSDTGPEDQAQPAVIYCHSVFITCYVVISLMNPHLLNQILAWEKQILNNIDP